MPARNDAGRQARRTILTATAAAILAGLLALSWIGRVALETYRAETEKTQRANHVQTEKIPRP